MSVDQLFEQYPENIIAFRIGGSENTTKIIDFWFNNEWEILDSKEPNQGEGHYLTQLKRQEDSKSYYIIFSDTLSFEQLYAHLGNMIQHNIDIEKKKALFSKKLQELKNLFTKLSYDELKTMGFDTTYISSMDVEKGEEEMVEPEVEEEDNILDAHKED